MTLKPFIPALAAGLLTAPLAAQAPDLSTWRGDVDVLIRTVDSLHPAPYRIHPRAEWEAAAQRFKSELPRLDIPRAVAGFARLLALLEDGHSRLGQVNLTGHARPELATVTGFATTFPIEFEFFANGLYVTRAARSHTDLLGGRVTAVAGRPVRAAGAALAPFISRDNEMWLLYMLPHFLRRPGYLFAAGLLPRPDAPLALTVTDRAGRERMVHLSPVPGDGAAEWVDARRHLGGPDSLPLWQRMPGPYAFTYLRGRHAVYVRYAEVRHAEAESIPAFANRLFRFVDSAAVDRVVIDVRRNGGGNNYLNQPLVHGLIRSARLGNPGRLVVLTDRGTFSAAISFIADVERNTWAAFVGEAPGSPSNHYGDPARVTLPNSGLLVRISTLHWQGADPRDPRPGILPDSLVIPTFGDWLQSRDPVLEAALTMDLGTIQWPPTPNLNITRPAQRKPFRTGIEW